MNDNPDVASVASLIGDPARGRMLTALMEGRALTATELALEGGVAPSTASSHLERLARGGLVTMARQGRHRYFRIGGPDVAAALEGLMAIAPRARRSIDRLGRVDEALRHARVCYDHLAGEAGVRFLDSVSERKWLRGSRHGIAITPEGEEWFQGLGIDVEALRQERRPLCRPCLDWSERRFHLAGALGAAILDRLFALRWARRVACTRAVTFSSRGAAFLETLQPPRPEERRR
jgi:DNA-binding transcriptional ArsR family regulator